MLTLLIIYKPKKPTPVVNVSGKFVMTVGNTTVSFGNHHVLCPMVFLDLKIRQQITSIVKLFSDLVRI